MKMTVLRWIVAAAAIGAFPASHAQDKAAGSGWQKHFNLASCKMVTTGRNAYFVLEPGYQLVYEGGDVKLQITVLNETRKVDGVETRVVEEKEWKAGKLSEIARNYFAICEQTKDVYYFGEDVDFYENGKVVNHEGSWLAGVKGNRPGLMMAGEPKLKMKYYQEIAPGVAMDRAEIVALDETCKTPAGTFSRCMKIKEGSELEPLVAEHKYYAPAVGFVGDDTLRLIKYGFVGGK